MQGFVRPLKFYKLTKRTLPKIHTHLFQKLKEQRNTHTQTLKKMKILYPALCVVMFVVLFVDQTQVISAAESCNPVELLPCANILTSPSTPPSPPCCSRLKTQIPCLCQYKTNPAFQKYINSINTGLVAKTCGISFPSCFSN